MESEEEFIPISDIFQQQEELHGRMFSLPKQRRCAYHSLNLIAKEDLKKMDFGFKRLKDSVDEKLKVVSNFVRPIT